MTPAQVEGMIDRIVGVYPAQNVSRNAMKATWGQDEYLLSIPVDEARNVMPLVEAHNKIPSLPEIKNMFRTLRKEKVTAVAVECEICSGDGWDTGQREDAFGRIWQKFYTQIIDGVERNVVKRCECKGLFSK